MKRLVHILVLACLMAACTSPVETRHGASLPTDDMHPRLAAIDSLMWQQPDSALAVLLDFAGSPLADSLDAFDGHYCQMLVSELLYKNDCEQSNRTELLRAVDYFDSLCISGDVPWRVSTRDIVFLDARAHYINGVGFYERDSLAEACAEYLKTLEIMESRFGEKELVGKKARFMAYTYNRLGDMFSGQLLAEPAITCFKRALFYCKREPTSKYGIPVLLYYLGIQYDVANQKDSAAFYYDEALANMPDFDNLHYRDLMASKSLLAYNMGFYVDSIIGSLKHVISLASDDEERISRYLTLGNVLFEEKQYDSSCFYLEMVFEQQEDIASRIVAAENLCNIYQIKGDSVKARQYSLFLAKFTMAEIEKKRDLSKIDEMFKNYSAYKQNKHAEEERETAIERVIRIVIPIVVVVALAIVVVAKRRGRKQMADKEMEYEKALECERQTHQMQQAALSGRLKQSNETLRELKMQVAKQKEEAASQTEQAATFAEEPICRLIVERVNEGQFKSKVDYEEYKDYALDKNQLLSLREAADRHFGQFTVRLKQAYPKLTNSDLDYCCLYLLGLSDADVSALMQKAYSTVSDRSRKLKTIFGKEDLLVHILRQIAEN